MGPEGGLGLSGSTCAPVHVGGHSPYGGVPPAHDAPVRSSSAGTSGSLSRQRTVIKTLNEVDGMVYSLVFEGSLNRLSVRQLKRHLQETTGLAVSQQVLCCEGRPLPDTASCGSCGVAGGAMLQLSTAATAAAPPPPPPPSHHPYPVPQPGMQPQQLPPPGAAVPVPRPRVSITEPVPPPPAHHIARQLHSGAAPSFVVPSQESSPSPSAQPQAHHPHYQQHHSQQQHGHHGHQGQREQVPHSALHDAVERNNERLRQLQHDEMLLRERESRLQAEEAALACRQRELEASASGRRLSNSSGAYSNTGLTVEQLTRHNDLADEDEIVSVEELPPAPAARSHRHTRRFSHRTAGTSPGHSLRSRSTWMSQASDRGFELDSLWRMQSSKFDEQRLTSAMQMERLEKQLAEREADLRQKESEVLHDLDYIGEKRLIVESLKARVF